MAGPLPLAWGLQGPRVRPGPWAPDWHWDPGGGRGRGQPGKRPVTSQKLRPRTLNLGLGSANISLIKTRPIRITRTHWPGGCGRRVHWPGLGGRGYHWLRLRGSAPLDRPRQIAL